MAIARSTLDHNIANPGSTTQDTASISPASNALVLVSIHTYTFGHQSVTLSGNGLTWVSINTTTLSGNDDVTMFRGMGASPSSGAITITCTGAMITAIWSVEQFTGTDTSGTNGSGAIVQSGIVTDDSGGNPTITLSALGDATNNAVYALFGNAGLNSASPGTGYTELTEDSDGVQFLEMETEWKLPGTTTPNVTYGGGNASGVAVEIKAAASGIAIPVLLNQYRSRWN